MLSCLICSKIHPAGAPQPIPGQSGCLRPCSHSHSADCANAHLVVLLSNSLSMFTPPRLGFYLMCPPPTSGHCIFKTPSVRVATCQCTVWSGHIHSWASVADTSVRLVRPTGIVTGSLFACSCCACLLSSVLLATPADTLPHPTTLIQSPSATAVMGVADGHALC